jgi:hypothetical protein
MDILSGWRGIVMAAAPLEAATEVLQCASALQGDTQTTL